MRFPPPLSSFTRNLLIDVYKRQDLNGLMGLGIGGMNQ